MIELDWHNSHTHRYFWNAVGAGVSGLINSVGNIISTNQTNKANLKIARETNKANRDLAEYAYQQNLAQWNRENEYNSPVAQMDRLRQAGLNPNLVYGNGGATSTAAKSPQYDAPTMQGATMQPYTNVDFGIGSAVETYMRSELLEQQIQDAIANRVHLNEQNQLLKAQTLVALTNRKQGELDYQIKNSTKEASIRLAESLASGAEKDLDLKDATLLEKQENVRLLQEKVGLTHQQALQVQKSMDVMAADIVLKTSQAGLNNIQAQKVRQDFQFDHETFQARKRTIKAIMTETINRSANELKKGKLTEQTIKKLEQDIRIELERHDFDIAKISQAELRSWIYGWIPSGNTPGYSGNSRYGVTVTAQ